MTWSRETKNSCIDTATTERINRGGWGRQAISNSEKHGKRCGANKHQSRDSKLGIRHGREHCSVDYSDIEFGICSMETLIMRGTLRGADLRARPHCERDRERERAGYF